MTERKRSTPLQEDYRLPSQRPLWETLGLTGCCNACHTFTLPPLCSLLPFVNSLNELSGIFWPRPISSSWTGKCLLNSWHCNCYGERLLFITEKPWTTKLLSCFCTPSESTSLASAMMLMDDHSGGKAATGKTHSRATRNATLHLPCDFYKSWDPRLQFKPSGRINPQHPTKTPGSSLYDWSFHKTHLCCQEQQNRLPDPARNYQQIAQWENCFHKVKV